MFEILEYLVENYFPSGDYPDAETLSRRLSAAGFEREEISAALDWLSALERAGHSRVSDRFSHSGGFRVYTDQELANTTADTRGFLLFLENAGILNAPQRELIIERIAALEEPGIALERVKLIVLMVLWNQKQPLDALLVEELLAAAEERYPH
jgi:Smg protein